MTFIKTYLGWIISGLLLGVIIYLLFRPVPVPDNHILQNRVDSLAKVDNAKDSALMALQARLTPKDDSLTKLVADLQDQAALNVNIMDGHEEIIYSLSKQVQYYKAKEDRGAYDSACDLLAKKVISDSLIVRTYQENENHIIQSMGSLISDKDSIIVTQQSVIIEKSALIAAQKTLNETQTKQIKKLSSTGKVFAWVGRALFVIAVAEGVALAAHK